MTNPTDFRNGDSVVHMLHRSRKAVVITDTYRKVGMVTIEFEDGEQQRLVLTTLLTHAPAWNPKGYDDDND